MVPDVALASRVVDLSEAQDAALPLRLWAEGIASRDPLLLVFFKLLVDGAGTSLADGGIVYVMARNAPTQKMYWNVRLSRKGPMVQIAERIMNLCCDEFYSSLDELSTVRSLLYGQLR
mgnify:CR=1 FL=1